jgi:ABC-type dipeptide/oligopeptide/nickel transport system permease component
MFAFLGDHMLSIVKFMVGSVYLVFLIIPFYMAKYFQQMEKQKRREHWNEQREKYKLAVQKRKKRTVNY